MGKGGGGGLGKKGKGGSTRLQQQGTWASCAGNTAEFEAVE